MDLTIRLLDVCERDIDLMLLEEFVASSDFQSWFLSQIGVEQSAALIEACRSVKTVNGESDLELTFLCSSGAVKILIENKVDAAFQPNQSQRYAERAGLYRATRKYHNVLTVAMAPGIYFGKKIDDLGFNVIVTYEAVYRWLERANLGSRKVYKLALLGRAIERGRLGWKPVPHRAVGEFWQAYWRLCEEIAPQLAMPVPKGEIPAESHFIGFKPAILPAHVFRCHKVAYGHVDLQFSAMGEKLAEMEQIYRSSLLPSMRIEKAAKSAVIRIRVEPIDMTTATFPDCEASIRRGVEAAVLLMDWYSKLQILTGQTMKLDTGV